MTDIRQALETLRAARTKTHDELTRLDAAIRALQGLVGSTQVIAKGPVAKPRRKMSAAARRKIAAAQSARWAKVRKQKAEP